MQRKAKIFYDLCRSLYQFWCCTHDASYVFTTSCRQGAGVSDGDIDALVEINHRGAHEFAPRADRFGVLNRARLACAEGAAHRVGQWLLSQIERRSHVALTMAHRR